MVISSSKYSQSSGTITRQQGCSREGPPVSQASGKQASFFNKPLRSPASFADVEVVEALSEGIAPLAIGSPPANYLDKA